MDIINNLTLILNHRHLVETNTRKVGIKLIENKLINLGVRLIHAGSIHDASKLVGIEYDAFVLGNSKVKEEAIYHHQHLNLHHPEAWPDGICSMDRLYLYELSCDWTARASEFGTSVMDWIETKAMDRYKFTKKSEAYKEISKCLNLLLEKPF